MKRLSVSIGIPAYNEEKNIGHLLMEILKQQQKEWKLSEIIVVSDGSTDNTVEESRHIRSPLIKVLNKKKRRGQTSAFNHLLKIFRGDVLILFDADIRIGSKQTITNLISGFKDNTVMLASGNKRPNYPRTFVERGIYSTFKVFYESKLKIKDGNNIFGCQGGCIAITRKFANTIHLPDIISNDAYFYLFCITAGYKFKYEDQAIVYYKNASNLTDYLKQLFRSRPTSVGIFLKKCFGDLVQQEFHRPLGFYTSSIFKVLLEDPLPTIFIVLVNLVATPFIPFMARKYVGYWPIATSTK